MTVEKVAVVTAGGSGIGAAAARRFSRDGYKVAILSSSGKGEALANELGGFGLTGSNQSPADIKKLIDGAVDRWGRIDALVNSAGHGPRGPVLELTDEDWHQGLETYLLNALRPTRLVVPIMQRQKGGAIINISSAWAFEPTPQFPTSNVFRAGLASLVKIIADTYASDNIRVNNVLPGWIDSLPETAERRENVPLGRYGTPEEIAATIAFLASEGGGYITGQNIRVDGGLIHMRDHQHAPARTIGDDSGDEAGGIEFEVEGGAGFAIVVHEWRRTSRAGRCQRFLIASISSALFILERPSIPTDRASSYRDALLRSSSRVERWSSEPLARALAIRAAFSFDAPSRRRSSYSLSSLICDPWFFAMIRLLRDPVERSVAK